jgi:hypothetical protein
MPAALIALALAGTALAEVPEGQAVRLEVSPAHPSEPALRYALLPDVGDLRPGNAADHYRKAFAAHREFAGRAGEGWAGQADRWLETPPADVPRKEVRALLNAAGPVFAGLEAGARREHCDWGHAELLRKEGIRARLAEIQECRGLARLAALRARLALAEGDVGRAVRDLRTGYALARHADRSPILISHLVAAAVAARTTDQLEELLRRPDAPSLYWPLTDLPRPLLDFRRALRGERLLLVGTFPGLAEAADDPDAGPAPQDQVAQWRKLLLDSLDVPDGEQFLAGRLLALRIVRTHEAAKRELKAAGRPRAKLDAMPHLQVALLHALLHYDRLRDDYLKYQSLPHPEAQEKTRAVLRRADAERRKSLDVWDTAAPALPLLALFLPAVDKVRVAHVRIERRVDAFRVVEALRLYAGAHGGKLPKSLADVNEAPVPDDPATGKPFGYKLSGRTATLTAPPIPGGSAGELAYEITLKH